MNVTDLIEDIILQTIRLRQHLEVYTNRMLLQSAQTIARDAAELAGLLETRLPEKPPCHPNSASAPKASTRGTATATRSAETATPGPSSSTRRRPGKRSRPAGGAPPATSGGPSTTSTG